MIKTETANEVKGTTMRIKEQEYKQAAWVMVRDAVRNFNAVRSSGKTPSRITLDSIMRHQFPSKWTDGNTEGKGFTRHNENKLRKYVSIELRVIKSIFPASSRGWE